MSAEPELMRLLSRRLDQTNLTKKVANALGKEGIYTIRDVVEKTEGELLDIENFGPKALEEVRRLLDTYNLRFGSVIGADRMRKMVWQMLGEPAPPPENLKLFGYVVKLPPNIENVRHAGSSHCYITVKPEDVTPIWKQG